MSFRNSDLFVTTLKLAEGFRGRPYDDATGKTLVAQGKVTIGYGRNVTDVPLEEFEALSLLENDIHRTMTALAKALPWLGELDEIRQCVLLEMAFNMGVEGLMKWVPTLALVRAKRFKEAADRMLKQKWATQVKGRAIRLARTMETGVWQIK